MKFIAKTCVLCASLAGLCLSASARADALFTFDTGVAAGTDTPFSITDNGVTAQFSSTTGDFKVGPAGFAAPFSGNALLDSSQGDDAFIPLFINFNTLVTGISMDFVTDDFDAPTPLQLIAFNGSTEVGTNQATGSGFFPQGVLSFNGAAFDSVALFDNDTPAFAIDNVDVSTAGGTFGVPEINVDGFGSLATLLLGTLALLQDQRSRVRREAQP